MKDSEPIVRRSDARIPECHPEKRHVARGLCTSCYPKWLVKKDPEAARARWRKSYHAHQPQKRAYYRKRREDPEYVEHCRARDRAYSTTDRRREKHRQNYHKLDVKARLFARKYNVPVEQIYKLFATTQCEVCGSDQQLHIDHDHRDGYIRGRLCGKCNKAIGLLADDSERVLELFRYLKKSEARIRLVS